MMRASTPPNPVESRRASDEARRAVANTYAAILSRRTGRQWVAVVVDDEDEEEAKAA